jgi:cytidylate kinase
MEEEKNTKTSKTVNGRINVIAIDGPAGSGKSTIAKLLSLRLGLNYIDTGATYRAITLLAIENKIDPEDEEKILELAKIAKIEIDHSPKDAKDYTTVRLNGKDVTEEIRSPEVGTLVSVVSKLSGIRKFLVDFQRKIASLGPSVLEGRDIGSVVFPDAVLKIYLTADNSERVRRRQRQEKEKGKEVKTESIKKEIETRDSIDSSRKDSPLIIPEDAVVIDSTKLTIEETFKFIKELYHERLQSEN